MKIELDVKTVTKTEFDVDFPVYLKDGSFLYCYYDPENLTKHILLTDMSIGKGVESFVDVHQPLDQILARASTFKTTKEVFQNKLVEILSIINGAVDEMHTADEQQEGSKD